MSTQNWRTINIDLLDSESSANFDVKSLLPPVSSTSSSEVQSIASQIRQLLRGGDTEGALRGALENAPYGGDNAAKVSLMLIATRERPERMFSRKHDWYTDCATFLDLCSDTGDSSSYCRGNITIDQAIGDVSNAE